MWVLILLKILKKHQQQNEDDPIRTDIDKEPIKLTLRKNSKEGNNEYYITSKIKVKKAKIM